MKKLKYFLCVAIVLCMGCLAFVGCKPTDPEDPETPPVTPPSNITITLDEAKTIINNALDTTEDEDIAQTLQASQSNNGNNKNRNIFVKLKNVEISMNGDFDYDTTISGYAKRNLSGDWKKYSLESGDQVGYFNGSEAYSKYEDNYQVTTFEDSYFGLILQSMDCIYVDLLFVDIAWTNIYNNSVEKNSKQDSYTLSLDIDMAKYVDFVMAECEARGLPAEGLFGEGDYKQKNKDEGTANVVVTMDKNNKIEGLEFSISSLNSDWEFITTTISIKGCKQEISQPQWVTDYLSNQ